MRARAGAGWDLLYLWHKLTIFYLLFDFRNCAPAFIKVIRNNQAQRFVCEINLEQGRIL